MDTLKDFLSGPAWAWTIVYYLGWFVAVVYVVWAGFCLYLLIARRRDEAAAWSRGRQMLEVQDRMLPEIDVPEQRAPIAVPYHPASTDNQVTAPLSTIPLPRRIVLIDGDRVPLEED